jgi:hypothetical protein
MDLLQTILSKRKKTRLVRHDHCSWPTKSNRPNSLGTCDVRRALWLESDWTINLNGSCSRYYQDPGLVKLRVWLPSLSAV